MNFEDQIDALKMLQTNLQTVKESRIRSVLIIFFSGLQFEFRILTFQKEKTFDCLLLFRGSLEKLADKNQLAKSSAKYYETKNRTGTRMVDY